MARITSYNVCYTKLLREFYVDYIRVWQKTDYSTTVGPKRAAHPIPGVIEAEEFYMPSGIQTIGCSEGTTAVGYLDAGDWMDYSVTIAAAGSYNLCYRAATAWSGNIECYVDGTFQKSTSITSTGDWQRNNFV